MLYFYVKRDVANRGSKKGVNMKPDYKNWVPLGMLQGLFGGVIVLLMLSGLAFFAQPSGVRIVLAGVLLTVTFLLFLLSCWMLFLYRAFSYTGKMQISRRIINGVADHVHIPDGGVGLDVGCGSGALTIACAKRNPCARMIGIDYWGKIYASFSKMLCESNAFRENTPNVVFQQGDARHLSFPDETFDLVTSNYVYHDIYGMDRQDLVLETLRTLKKGGSFVIHDFMPRWIYGDLEDFAQRLRDLGYQEVHIIDTANGMFITRREAIFLFLTHSTLLVGTK